ncbi:DUF1343 domain-containing protein [Stieleria sp. TO1_6]|uniref:exo-beta-N-acetylmuramidase NamZ family protein n=1 Tax=Stieleria tagensis TaxID=2956795 RepID=UPI00209A98F0|nr:DUF1343 domain-containing protein [Stieleria tagensis]MCO8122128.1 DUF1343 domain-containing protein [Stieleria tagensis]
MKLFFFASADIAKYVLRVGLVLLACWGVNLPAFVGTGAAGTAVGQEPSVQPSLPVVLAGIDVLRRDGFGMLRGQRVGLITNQTGRCRDGTSTAQLLAESDQVQLTALFSPEHGFRGELDVAAIGNSTDTQTGVEIFSLYGKTRRPTAEMLDQIDVLVFDIQDIGARFYTYISTMGEAMQAADEHGKRFVVLDRPNPITGQTVSGPMLDDGQESFVGFHSLPIRHAMTIGELAKLFHAELGLTCPLDVVQCDGWRRQMWWDQTGLLWINPSPNMRNLTQAMLYPGVGMLETTNLSVGRGTDTPFEVIGAPWIDPLTFAAELKQCKLSGVTVVPIRFTPDASRYRDESCGGVNLIVTDREQFDPLRLGVALAVTLQKRYGQQWNAGDAMRLLGSRPTLDAIESGQSVDQVMSITRAGVDEFLTRRSGHLIYD